VINGEPCLWVDGSNVRLNRLRLVARDRSGIFARRSDLGLDGVEVEAVYGCNLQQFSSGTFADCTFVSPIGSGVGLEVQYHSFAMLRNDNGTPLNNTFRNYTQGIDVVFGGAVVYSEAPVFQGNGQDVRAHGLGRYGPRD
jgi:hypothetical protein